MGISLMLYSIFFFYKIYLTLQGVGDLIIHSVTYLNQNNLLSLLFAAAIRLAELVNPWI